MTEGECEKALLDLLLERSLLIFSYDDLLYQETFHARQLDSRLLAMIDQLPKGEKICIIRVGDKLSDELKRKKEIKPRIESIIKVCTKPEFEILHIIREGKYKEYLKEKTSLKPSEYYRSIHDGYHKSYSFNEDYFSELTDDELRHLLKEYDEKRKHVHGAGELSLNDLLRH